MAKKDRPQPEEFEEQAAELHEDALVLDLHADTPTAYFMEPSFVFGERHETGHIDLPRLRDAGVDGEFFIAWVPPELSGDEGAAFEFAEEVIEKVHETAERTDGARIATGVGDLDEALEADELAMFIGVEGGHAIEGSLDRLEDFHDLGARSMTLTWNNANGWADSCCAPPEHGGLTDFGRDVVGAMNELGMLVDLSHAADSTFWDTIEVSKDPVMVSHSCCRGLVNHPRNVSDEMLEAIRDKGGVVGINFYAGFLDKNVAERSIAVRESARRFEEHVRKTAVDTATAIREAREYRARVVSKLPRPKPKTLVEHVVHMVEVAGPDHVALGTDFDGIQRLPNEITDVTDLPWLTAAMMARGLSEETIRKILGGNVRRLLEEVVG